MVKDGKMKEIWEKMNQAEKWADEHEYQKLKNKVDALKNEKESYFRNREGSHPRVKKIEQELAELERKMRVFEDSAEQLKLMGITQDADPDEVAKKREIARLSEFIKKHPVGSNNKLISQALREAREKLSKLLNTKDDDATEHGSIETYGKEKETETMPLEKNPVQAQDSEVNYKGWRIVTKPDPRKGYSGYVAEIIPPKWSRPYDGTANHKLESEAIEECRKLVDLYVKEGVGQKDETPADVKDTKADGDPETMTTQEAREYWNKYHNSDPILEDYPSFEAWYRESKRNGYIVDHVQDSYEMLKLCGIVNDTRPLVGEVVEVDSPRVGQFTGRCVSVSSNWADIKILHMKNGKEPGIREGDIVSVNFEYIKV